MAKAWQSSRLTATFPGLADVRANYQLAIHCAARADLAARWHAVRHAE